MTMEPGEKTLWQKSGAGLSMMEQMDVQQNRPFHQTPTVPPHRFAWAARAGSKAKRILPAGAYVKVKQGPPVVKDLEKWSVRESFATR